MKHITRILFVSLAALALIAASFVAASGAQPAQAGAGQVFTVYPSGVDDTDNLNQAFDLAKAAGPGSTVLLAPGYFKIRLMEVTDFDGYFKGSGQEVTFVDTFEDQDCQAWFDAGHSISIIQFVGGYTRISDLTFRITPQRPCHETEAIGSWIQAIGFSISPFNPDTDCMTRQTEPRSALVQRVTVEGKHWWVGEEEAWNLLVGIFWGGSGNYNYWDSCQYVIKFAKGKFEVKQSTIRSVIWGIGGAGGDNSQVIFGGSASDGNIFEDVPVPTEGWDFSNSYFEVSHNVMKNIGLGFWFTQGQGNPFPYIVSPSTFNIHHNDMTLADYGIGIYLQDYDNTDGWYPRVGQRIIANLHHNKITIPPTYAVGILTMWVDGARIHQNTMYGSSEWAMVFFGPSRDVQIMDNDLHNYVSVNGPQEILLAEGTKNYRVTVDEPDSVLDLGVNNWINEKLHQGGKALDQAIIAMMERKLEVLKAMTARMPGQFRNRFMLPELKP